MMLAFALPPTQYGFWLPVYHGDESAERAIKRIVLREFRRTVHMLRKEGTFVRVKDFTWMEHRDFLDCTCELFSRTFAWKAHIQVVEIVK